MFSLWFTLNVVKPEYVGVPNLKVNRIFRFVFVFVNSLHAHTLIHPESNLYVAMQELNTVEKLELRVQVSSFDCSSPVFIWVKNLIIVTASSLFYAL